MKALHKNIIREISRTKSRFLSILAIIAISTGFFTGVKAASPSMLETGRNYFNTNNLMDIRLLSTVGFDDDDIEAIRNSESTDEVMPAYFADLIISEKDVDQVVRVHSIPQASEHGSKTLNELVMKEGRMPKNDDECILDDYYFRQYKYKLGDKITFKAETENGKITDTLKHSEYTIVGTANSPQYLTYMRGNTNIGSGAILMFVMLKPTEFKTERYTDVYVKTKASTKYTDTLTDEYKELVNEEKDEYTKLSKERIKYFNEVTYSDAVKKLEDARKEYNTSKKDAEKDISDGEKKLHDGERELQEKLLEGQKKIDDGEKELEDGKKQLEEAQEKYNQGIEEGKKKITDGQLQLAQGKAEYEKAKNTYDIEMEKAQRQLDNAQKEYDTQRQLFYNTTKPQAESMLTLLKTAIEAADKAIEKTEKAIADISEDSDLSELTKKLDEYKGKLDELKKQYDDGMAQLAQGEAKLNEAKQQLDDAWNEFETKKTDASTQLNEAKLKLDYAQTELDNGKLELETSMSTGTLKLEQARRKIEDGEKELQKGKEELEKKKAEGMQTLKESREKLANGKNTARIELGDAEKKLRDAQEKLDKLDNAKWMVYDRQDNVGYSGFVEDALRVDNIATVFPVFFLLVAALVSLTTMSRMVEERRVEIGTLKALGYSNTAIASKYFIYAASAALIGSIAGAVIGIATLPYIILETYGILYLLPATILSIPWGSFIFSAGTGILCTCTVAVFTCLGELVSKPAVLMRPKAPKPGKRILLEYFTPLWSRMSFISKVTARNLFRYKARFMMTVIGVAGCTALIVGGLGLRDSIGIVADLQYGQITLYDEVYALSESGTAKENEYIMSLLRKDERLKNPLLTNHEWLNFRYNNESREERLIVPEDNETFKKMFVLRDRETKERLELQDDGVILNDRLGEVLGLKAGDKIKFTLDGKEYETKITALSENYTGNYVYMNPAMYQKLTGHDIKYNIIYVQLNEEVESDEHEISNDYVKLDEILTVSLTNEQVGAIVKTLDSLNIIVFVLIFCAGMLAMVVLYNLTNINITERVREIATIKVLGFYNLETANYIYRENLILTIFGGLAGLPIGMLFTSFIMEELQMDVAVFPKYIEPISFLLGFIITLLFSLTVNFIMYFKMKKISMVESLKSIE